MKLAFALIGGLAAFSMLAGCGSKKPEPVVPAAPVVPVDTRPSVDQVVSLDVDRVPSGAVVTATAVPPVQGWWDADLVLVQPAAGSASDVMTFRFAARPPVKAADAPQPAVSTVASRRLTAGVYIPADRLAGIRRIVVQGASNQMTAAR